MTKVFIDGKEGTTGLKILERFVNRKDIALLELAEKYRKDVSARRDMINQSDITFLCLPDDAAREAAALKENGKVKIIDASSAHRTHPDWCYGFPELSVTHRKNIKNGSNISVPGCHASGFLAIVYPLTQRGVMPKDYSACCHSLTGYSGGGKKMIDEYQKNAIVAPRQYALAQEHKHLKEMQSVAGLKDAPLFNPIVCNFYSGMAVTVPLHSHLLINRPDAKQIHSIISEYYDQQKLIKVMPFEEGDKRILSATALKDSSAMEIYVSGGEERINLVALYDNLGKGASGAAVQCMNIMLGLSEDYSL